MTMVSSRFAILQALRQGPAYGQQLSRRVRSASQGQKSLAPGSVYPSLRSLERAGLARSWKVTPGRERGGRSREYFELTIRGIRKAEREAAAVVGLMHAHRAQPASPRPTQGEMRERLERVDGLFEFAREVGESLDRRRRP